MNRLEELKQLVLNGLYTDETSDEDEFSNYCPISTLEQADLLAILDTAIAEQSQQLSEDDVQRAITEFADNEWQYEIRDNYNNFHGKYDHMSDKPEGSEK